MLRSSNGSFGKKVGMVHAEDPVGELLTMALEKAEASSMLDGEVTESRGQEE